MKVLFIAIGFLSLLACKQEDYTQVCFKDTCFQAEVAATKDKRAQGLMFRKTLDYGKGMLFVYGQEARYSFWMKNTQIPLDIIWSDKDRKVVHIEKNALPCVEEFCPSLQPQRNAMYVLELNSGVSDDIGLKLGDEMVLEAE